jgi:hypothetical protein
MNELILITHATKYGIFGVIKTLCFPCSFYGGELYKHGNEYIPADNSAGFFRDEYEALNNAEKLAKQHREYDTYENQ